MVVWCPNLFLRLVELADRLECSLNRLINSIVTLRRGRAFMNEIIGVSIPQCNYP